MNGPGQQHTASESLVADGEESGAVGGDIRLARPCHQRYIDRILKPFGRAQADGVQHTIR